MIVLPKGQFIIGSLSNAGLSVAREPSRHSTQEKAAAEAERLARLDTSKEFVVLQVVGSVRVNSVVWK